MNRSANVTAAILTTTAALAVAGLVALAAPAVAATVSVLSSWPIFHAQAKPSETRAIAASADNAAPTGAPEGYVSLGQGLSVPAGGPGDCTTTSWLNTMKQGSEPAHVTLLGPDLVDMGPREFAEGTASRDDQGRIKTYTVAPGDVPSAIGDRFCLGNGIALGDINHTRTIHPGDVLILTPDPTLAWIPYYNPTDAPDGFKQIPYQTAIEAMGDASAAGDIDTMRSIWANKLAPMTTDQADLDAVAQALSKGDMTVLRQMFP